MSNHSLPFYSKFFGTFEKYTIEEWEAKDFIANVLGNHLNTEKNKQKVYQCGYLKRTINANKKSTFLYSETNKITDYRCSKNQENIAKALNEKMDAVQGSIIKKHIEVNFITGLKDEYPNIASQLITFEKEHIKNLDDLTTQQNVIKNLMNRFDIKKDQ